MRIRNLAVLTAFALAFALVGSSAWAADLKIDVPFAFMVGAKSMPAGQYIVQTESPDVNSITLRALKGGESAFVLAQTRLADRDNPVVVFDKMGDTYYLSEVHPGVTDGFAIQGATGKHTHVKISPKK